MSKQHPFDKGERVHVYNQTIGGKPFFEGTAEVLGRGEVANHYRVRFDGDHSTVLRFVWPHGQVADPKAYAAELVAAWEAR